MTVHRISFSAALLVAGLMLSQCTTHDSKLVPPASELAAQTGTDQAALAEGRSLYLAHCTGCRRHVWPRDRTPRQWRPTLKEHQGRVPLTKEEYDKVSLYILTTSKLAWETIPKAVMP